MPDREEENEQKNGKTPKPKDQLSTTQHYVVINGKEVNYSVTTGTIVLKEEIEKEEEYEGEKSKATMFFIAYTVDSIDGEQVVDRSQRPLTFSFNGGPGSSSVWLHLGLLGPRKVWMDEEGNQPPPPYRMVDNEYSLLDATDLVFIDPVSTGYSRVVPGEKAKEYHEFEKDIEAVGDFIRLYTTRYQRWLSPKFLIGESYGTTRAGGLAGFLQERHGMYLDGIILVSAILNFQTAMFDLSNPGNDLPYILFLPTYSATAWYHGRLPEEVKGGLKEVLEEVERFAMGDYALALMKGSALPEEEKKEIVENLVRYTGLTADYVERTNLRIRIHRFCKELLRDERRTVGRLDSRFSGVDRDAAGEHFEYDPAYATIQGVYTAALNHYVRAELDFQSDLSYEVLTSKVHPWIFEKQQNQLLNVGETLRKAMSMNPFLKVFVANGYYDLATPYMATKYTFDHLELDPELTANISMRFYEAGHMMYVHLPSLSLLKSDLLEFIQAAA